MISPSTIPRFLLKKLGDREENENIYVFRKKTDCLEIKEGLFR